MSTDRRRCRSAANSPIPHKKAVRNEVESPSRFEKNKHIKMEHAKNREKRTGQKENVPSLMAPTVASLYKRESFRDPARLHRRRSRSLDASAHLRKFRPNREQDNEYRPAYRAATATAGERLEDLVEMDEFNSDEDGSSESPLDVEQMRQEVDRAFAEAFPPIDDFLEGHGQDTTQTVRGGLSPLPPRIKDRLLDDDDEFIPEERPHSAGELSSFRLDKDILEDSGNLFENSSLLASPVLRRESESERITPPEIEGVDSIRGHPFRIDSSSSFDSTAAMRTSPRELSPFLVDTVRISIKGSESEGQSSTDHPLQPPRTLSNSVERDHRSGNDDRMFLQSDTAMKEGPLVQNWAQITEEPSRERYRSYGTREKPKVVRSLVWASVFAGLAVLVGTIFKGRP